MKEKSIGNAAHVKTEVLSSIKNEIHVITGGEISEPVVINGVSVNDPVSGKLRLHNIYIDEDGMLCGDLTSLNNSQMNGLIFGRDIEDLHKDDLTGILRTLLKISKCGERDDHGASDEESSNGRAGQLKFKRYLKLLWAKGRGA